MAQFMIKWGMLLVLIPLARAANSSFCSTKNVCGSYGFCDPNQSECFCPSGGFYPKYSTDASKGCNFTKGYYTTQFTKLNSVAYSSYQSSDLLYSSTTELDCRDACSKNTNCYAAFYNASWNCRLVLEELGSIIYTADENDIAYIFVLVGLKHKSTSVGAIAGGIAGVARDVDVGPIGPRKFTYSEIEDMTKKFNEKIGEGGFADVYKGWTKTGTELAVKLIRASNEVRDFQREISVLSVTHHWNLVDFLGYCTEKSKMILVYKFMVNGSLDRWIFDNSNPDTLLSWEKRFKIMTGVATGMSYLHEQCGNIVLHLDLKPQNILLDEKFIPKVADFGLSRLLDRDQSMAMTQTIRGTPLYLAPESLLGSGLNEKMDVYSFGIIMLETVAGRSILDLAGATLAEAVTALERENFFPFELVDPAIHRSVNATEAKRVIRVAFLCLLQNNERPPMSSVLHMLQGRIPIQAMSATQITTLKECFASKRPGMAFVNFPFGGNYSQSTSVSATYQPQFPPSPRLGSGR